MSGRERFDAKLHPGCSFAFLSNAKLHIAEGGQSRVRADANEQEQARRRQAEEAEKQRKSEEAQRQREIAQRAAQEKENARKAEGEST